MTHRTSISCAIPLLLVFACQTDRGGVPALELEECSPGGSPRELLRIENASEYRVYDVVDGVTVVGDGAEFGGAFLVDNCGGEPIRLEDSYGLLAGAAYLDGQAVLCSPNGPGAERGVWEILETGARGDRLDVANACAFGTASSFGFAYTDDGLVQYLPGGGLRTIPSVERPTLTWLGDMGLVRGRSAEDGLVVLPPGGADAIVVDGLPPVQFVATQGNASSWVFLATYTEGSAPPPSPIELGEPALFALDLATGAWFETGVVTGNGLLSRNFASAEDGLAAVVDGNLTFWRASWGGPLVSDIPSPLGVSLIDGERAVVATASGLQLVEVPLERLEDVDEPVALEVIWSRALAEGDVTPQSAGVPWKDVVLVEAAENVWAYPLDGGDPFPFLPSLGFTESAFPTLGYTHLGSEFVTALARNPSDEADFWLFRNRLGGELEVLDTDIQGAPPLNSSGFIYEELYRWTPQLGRILYVVRDGGSVSVRQHVLTD